MSVDNRTSNQTSALKRKKMFLAWLPVTSRSHAHTNVRLVYDSAYCHGDRVSGQHKNFMQYEEVKHLIKAQGITSGHDEQKQKQ